MLYVYILNLDILNQGLYVDSKSLPNHLSTRQKGNGDYFSPCLTPISQGKNAVFK